MKKLLALFCVSLLASAAFADLDFDLDSFGVYFDIEGNSNNIAVQPAFTPFNAYLVLMNPRSITDGFECTVTPVGVPYFLLSTTLPGGCIDVDGTDNGFAVGAAAPFVVTPHNSIVCCTWSVMLQGTSTLSWFITQAAAPSLPGGLPVVTGEGILRRCGISSGDVTLPVARVNGPAPVAQEISSFGSVKSLFR